MDSKCERLLKLFLLEKNLDRVVDFSFHEYEISDWLNMNCGDKKEASLIIQEAKEKGHIINLKMDQLHDPRIIIVNLTENSFHNYIESILSETTKILTLEPEESIQYWKSRSQSLETNFFRLVQQCRIISANLPFDIKLPGDDPSFPSEESKSSSSEDPPKQPPTDPLPPNQLQLSLLQHSQSQPAQSQQPHPPTAQQSQSQPSHHPQTHLSSILPGKLNGLLQDLTTRSPRVTTMEEEETEEKRRVRPRRIVKNNSSNRDTRDGAVVHSPPSPVSNPIALPPFSSSPNLDEPRKHFQKTPSLKNLHGVLSARAKIFKSDILSYRELPEDAPISNLPNSTSTPNLNTPSSSSGNAEGGINFAPIYVNVTEKISGVTEKVKSVLEMGQGQVQEEENVPEPDVTFNFNSVPIEIDTPLVEISELVQFQSEFYMEKEVNDKPPHFKLLSFPDLYKKHFLNQKHVCFVGKLNSAEEYIIAAVSEQPTQIDKSFVYDALSNSKEGFRMFKIPEQTLNPNQNSPFLSKKRNLNIPQCENYLSFLFDATLIRIRDYVPFMKQVMSLEHSHGLRFRKLPIAIIYQQGDQKNPLEMFKNRNIEDVAWHQFLKDLGVVINEKGQESPGRISPPPPEFPTLDWNSIQVIFHICPLLDEEQHRRLVGNDTCVVFFSSNEAPFDPSNTSQLGNMPQVFLVVKPFGPLYRVSCYYRKALPPFEPFLVKGELLEARDLSDFTICKLYNGVLTSLTCPPMNKLIQRPRAAAINELVEKFNVYKRRNNNK